MKTREITYIVKDDCWECDSHATDLNGYPKCSVNKKREGIHRHYYRKYNGEIPEGYVVRHTCDNRLCINPKHLILGTHADNVADRVSRRRSACGENNGRAKLTYEEVKLIREDYSTSRSTLAKKFKVDPKVIRNIQQGKTWKNLKTNSMSEQEIELQVKQ